MIKGLMGAAKRSTLYRQLAPTGKRQSGSQAGPPPADVFEAMASWVLAASDAELDSSTRHRAKRAVLDGVVCLLLGTRAPEGRAVLALVQQSSAPGRCWVPGATARLPCATAAYAGTALCQVHDANDGHPSAGQRGASFHPGRIIVPAALAVAQDIELTGQAFLALVAVGYDIALGTSHGPRNSPSDAYGAAAVASCALGLDKAQTAFAMRIAGFSAPRSGAEDFETNNLTCAQQTRCGIESALLVHMGYPISKALNLEVGNFAFANPSYLGEQLHHLYFKPYPSCRSTHYFIEAALALRPRVIDSIASIEAIRITLPSNWRGPAHTVGPGEYHKSYAFSTSYCAIAALVDGEFGLRQLRKERTDDATLQHLQGRVTFVENSPVRPGRKAGRTEPAGTLEIELTDGTVHSQTVNAARGDPESPLSDEELAARLEQWSGATSQEVRALLSAVMSVDQMDSTASLMERLQALAHG